MADRLNINVTATPIGSARKRARFTPLVDNQSSGGRRFRGTSSNAHGRGRRRNSSRTPSSRSTSSTPSIPQTPSSHSRFVVSIVELRTKANEIGVAAINLTRPEVELFQFVDNQTYTNSLSILSSLNPSEVMLPDTMGSSLLCKLIEAEFELSRIEKLRRKYFNESYGLEFVRRFCVEDSDLDLAADSSKYLCLAALGCLIKKVEYSQSIVFASKSITLCLKSLDGHMLLDHRTIRSLELVNNANKGGIDGTLYSCLNKCQTPMGSRLLRRSIIQPLYDKATIQTRLEAVNEILSNEEGFFKLVIFLGKLPDMDQLNMNFATLQKGDSSYQAASKMRCIIQLRQNLELLSGFLEALSQFKSPLLKEIFNQLSMNQASELAAAIDTVLDMNTVTVVSKGPFAMAQHVMAVKTGLSGFLDVARTTYTQVVEEMHGLVERYCQELNLQLNVEFSSSRGYHVSMAKSLQDYPGVSDLFIKQVVRGSKVFMTSEDLLSLESRRTEAYSEILMMTTELIDHLNIAVRSHLGWMHRAAESLALLDMLVGFANVVTMHPGYVCPQIEAEGCIAIKQGRHPILEQKATSVYVPNDMFISPDTPMHLFTGPNCSGKSSLLQQTALIVLMAQIGSFVPAEQAVLRLSRNLFTVFPSNDSIDSSSGTFMAEMRNVSYILKHVSHNSLVLIDELGRGTSTLEAIGIYMSVLEELLRKKVFTMASTHFLELLELAHMYPGVEKHTLRVSTANNQIDFLFQVASVAMDTSLHYGHLIAKRAAFPQPVLLAAEELLTVIETASDRNRQTSSTDMHDVVSRLVRLKHTSLDEPGIRRYLGDLQASIRFA